MQLLLRGKELEGALRTVPYTVGGKTYNIAPDAAAKLETQQVLAKAQSGDKMPVWWQQYLAVQMDNLAQGKDIQPVMEWHKKWASAAAPQINIAQKAEEVGAKTAAREESKVKKQLQLGDTFWSLKEDYDKLNDLEMLKELGKEDKYWNGLYEKYAAKVRSIYADKHLVFGRDPRTGTVGFYTKEGNKVKLVAPWPFPNNIPKIASGK
jgi:hypothetical protein